jgi:hypothetical protein
MRKRTLAALVVSLAVSAPAASAAVRGARLTFPASALTEARAAAISYWGGLPPCRGPVRVGYSTHVPAINSGGVRLGRVWAWTTDFTTGVPGVYQDCLITLNASRWRPRAQARGFPLFCALMVHEYGHLFGHPDRASDPRSSITYPVIGPRNVRVPACVARYGDVRAAGRRVRAS